MSKKVFAIILLSLCLIMNTAYGEDLTVEKLLTSDTWKSLDASTVVDLVFLPDGTGTVSTGFTFHWDKTIFGVDCKYENYFGLVDSLNLIQENDIPLLLYGKDSNRRWARACDMASFSQSAIVGSTAGTDATTVTAEDSDTISAIKDLVLLDKDGIKIYFTGKFKEDNFLHMEVIVENNTNKNVIIKYSGKVNGWNLGSNHVIGNANPVHANSKAKCYLWFEPEDIDATTCREIESLDLIFEAQNKDTREKLFVA